MVIPIRLRRRLLLVLLCALGMAALAPGLSRLLAHWTDTNAPWHVVCVSPDMANATDGKPAGEGRSGLAGAAMDSCPYCLVRTDLAAPPPVMPVLAVLRAHWQRVPPLFLLAPRTLHAWHHAPARAPPTTA